MLAVLSLAMSVGPALIPHDPYAIELAAALQPPNFVHWLGPDDLVPRLRIDGALTFRSITGDVAAGVAALAPFGAGNPRPVFAARRVEIVDGPRKLKDRHLKMSLKQDGRIFRAVAWRAAEHHDFLAEHRAALDVAFSLEQNQYNGETYVELTLADLRESGEN